MRFKAVRNCPQRSPEQRRRDDAIVLASGLFTCLLMLLTVLAS